MLSLKRIGHEELHRERPQEHGARRDTGAEHGHELCRIPIERDVHRLAGAPGRTGVDEERELSRRGRQLEQTEIFGSEERQPQLEVERRDTAADQSVELGAALQRRGRRALVDIERAEIVAADERVGPDIERRQTWILGIAAAPADMERAQRERERSSKEVAAVVDPQRREAQVTGRPFVLEP